MDKYCPICKRWNKVVDKYGKEADEESDQFFCAECGHNWRKGG